MRQGKTATLRMALVLVLIASGNVHAGGETKTVAPSAATPTADAMAKAGAVAAYDAKNYREALRLFQPLADNGDADAQYYIGRLYEKGQGVSKDQQQVAKWYTRAAQGGHPEAQYRLAVGYAYGLAGMERDEKEAGRLLQSAAEGGHKKARKYLGRAYAEGRFGLWRDPVKAEYWTRKSEEK